MQDVPDATLVLKGKLASVGGLKAFRAKAGHSPGFALHALGLAISKVTPAPLQWLQTFPRQHWIHLRRQALLTFA